jgi:hypothetical protein
VFGLIAMPLGIQPARAVRSRGFAVSLVVIFTYYMLLSTGQGFAEQGASRRSSGSGCRTSCSARSGSRSSAAPAASAAHDGLARPRRPAARAALARSRADARHAFLPTITRHLIGEVLRTFLLMMIAFVAISILVYFFDRFDDFLKQGASAGTIALLFLYRVPLVVGR